MSEDSSEVRVPRAPSGTSLAPASRVCSSVRVLRRSVRPSVTLALAAPPVPVPVPVVPAGAVEEELTPAPAGDVVPEPDEPLPEQAARAATQARVASAEAIRDFIPRWSPAGGKRPINKGCVRAAGGHSPCPPAAVSRWCCSVGWSTVLSVRDDRRVAHTRLAVFDVAGEAPDVGRV